MSGVDLLIPDIGNFSDVAVVDVLVKPGEVVDIDSPLVTLETDKASMDVPASAAGTITEVLLKRGDKVSKGSLIARVEAAPPAASAAAQPAPAASAAGSAAPTVRKMVAMVNTPFTSKDLTGRGAHALRPQASQTGPAGRGQS